jgi:hypothetical protein
MYMESQLIGRWVIRPLALTTNPFSATVTELTMHAHPIKDSELRLCSLRYDGWNISLELLEPFLAN